MQCLHINIRQACFIVLALLINRSQMEDNEFTQSALLDKKNITFDKDNSEKITAGDLILRCPSDIQCKDLNEPCITCELSNKCRYGELVNTTCHVAARVNCQGPTQFPRSFICRYCYQTEHWEHTCELLANCNSVAAPRVPYVTNCTVKDDILCLGHRQFKKRIPCNWTGGYRWAVSLALSISLGGFGADRFYLGHWQEGIGKLFSFGGLGVWTIIDVILISLHYLGPADGSLYI